MKVLVQLRHSGAVHAAAASMAPNPQVVAGLVQSVAGLTIDAAFPPVQVPGVVSTAGGRPLSFSMAPAASTYVVRGVIPDGATQSTALAALAARPDVVGVYSDPVIEACPICGSDAPSGTAADVAEQLGFSGLHAAGMTGTGVYLAIVDSGVNLDHLQSVGAKPVLDPTKSWTPSGVPTAPGEHPVDHGTMCSFDAGIGAPKAVLLDHAILLSTTPGSTVMSGLLSDAVLSYSKLRSVLLAMPESTRAMVISNSWGMFSPKWDFPPGHPGNYSDNPNHPFNLIVGSLDEAGADILFAAGNCGRDCPDGRCDFGETAPICGANSHPQVLSVAGVDISSTRVGYSSQGPGRLSARKPDICGFTHFDGSRVYHPDADGGTSAACPVVAGAIAAVRSRYPSSAISPMQLRALVFKTARDLGKKGFDLDHGWGLIDPQALAAALP